jgi:hypothetical protein
MIKPWWVPSFVVGMLLKKGLAFKGRRASLIGTDTERPSVLRSYTDALFFSRIFFGGRDEDWIPAFASRNDTGEVVSCTGQAHSLAGLAKCA